MFNITVFHFVLASFSPEKKNFDHIMHLYNGLLKHNNSDIVIAVDSAEGIREYVFNGMRNLTEKAVQCLKHVRKTRIAVVSFAEQAKVIHRLDDCQKEDCIVNALRSLRYVTILDVNSSSLVPLLSVKLYQPAGGFFNSDTQEGGIKRGALLERGVYSQSQMTRI